MSLPHSQHVIFLIDIVIVYAFMSADFFQNQLFFQEYYLSVKQVGSRSGRTFFSGLIWVQTFCKIYEQTTLDKELTLYGPRREKTCLWGVANNTGRDQPAHPCSLISAFVICFLERIISKLATREISIF